MAEPVGVALIGIGMWGCRLAGVIRRTPSLKLVTAFNRDAAKRAAFAQEFGCEAADSFESAVEHPAVEGVLLITPNDLHAEQAIACAERGKHLFIEKPIANTLDEGYSIQRACRAAGIVLMVGHCFRRLGAARKVKALIEQDAIGEVVLAESNFSLPAVLTPDRWHYYRASNPGGALMQLGVHHADTLQYWLGPAVSVSGSIARLATQAESDDVGSAQIEFASGARGVINSTAVSPKTYYLRLYGSKGNLLYDTDMSIWPNAEKMDRSTILTLVTQSGSERVSFDTRDMLVEELDEFACCVHGEVEPETGAAEAIAALGVIRGAIESAETGHIVTMEKV